MLENSLVGDRSNHISSLRRTPAITFVEEVDVMEGTVNRYQPRNGATRLPDLVNRLFNESFVIPSLLENATVSGSSYPSLPVSLFETPDSYIMRAALPDIDAENVEIKVTGREVTLKGQFTPWTP